ncbi:peptidoglycan recognition protein [Streptomyces sp. NPDC052052]|uniref:peptidoglycan recognition protein family protein n=1 Tax=Streptomyces sp. NPDC052052 TaxID=3154756 RepID=UPI0034326CB8
MRAFLASSIGVACAAVLALPPAVPAVAAEPAGIAGSTQSLPMSPLPTPSDRDGGEATRTGEQGLTEREVHPFSLVGVVWDDVDVELHGTVQVRTRTIGTTRWSDWQDLETHDAEHGADPGTDEREAGTVRGSTAPLWVGASDGVAARVRPDTTGPQDRTAPVEPLPTGLRLELVDPGEDPQQFPAADTESGGDARTAPPDVRVLDALGRAESEARGEKEAGLVPGAQPFIGPRPRIITRKGWGADEKLRERAFAYTKTVKAAFIHHSATGNSYTCSQAASVLRGIYRYHVKSNGWRDLGYNFAVDKCGNIYEGRAGGVTKAVLGAHTRGFNSNSMGIAVIGTFSRSNPPAAAVNAVAKLTAWKLGLFGVDPSGRTTLVSAGGNKYKKGKKVTLNVISGHRDGFMTECPGARLYEKLGSARTSSARLQGR